MDTIFGLTFTWIVVAIHTGYSVLVMAAKLRQDKLPAEYCQFETFSAECARDEVIIMTETLYGRKDRNRCVQQDFGYVGCYADVLDLSHQRCSGRRACSIRVPDEQFQARNNNCPSDLSGYMIASYRCQKVFTPVGKCYPGDNMKVPPTSGILASATTFETDCGTHEKPYLIEGKPGQNVVLRMRDFNIKTRNNTSRGTKPLPCHVYAIVSEFGRAPTESLCGGKSQNLTHTSTSHAVEVRIIRGSPEKERYFLLEYEVIGCGDMEAPPGAIAQRNGNVTYVTCVGAEVRWKYECVGTEWMGEMDSCAAESTHEETGGKVRLTSSFSVFLVVSVAFGIGIIILVVGLICLRRRRCYQNGRRNLHREDPPPYDTYKTTGMTYMPSSPLSKFGRSDTSDDNEYEYIEDLKPAMYPPPGGFMKSTTPRGCVKHALPPKLPNTLPPGVVSAKDIQNMNKSKYEYMSPHENEYTQDNSSTCSPQYFELETDREERGGRPRNTNTGPGVAHPAPSRREEMFEPNEETKRQMRNQQYFGHYSQ